MTREEQLFNEALALPPADRAAFLARACAGDEPLHRRLAELLDAYASSSDFLAAPALPPPPGLIEEKPGDILGRYTLVSKLGEGGCGSVYLAEQHEPVRRHVALKVIKLGMDTREVIARFEAERQALALMDHPNIARVFDAGATAAGRPYFVMEFVDGVPITQFCDTQQLAVPERLDLFARLCLALQHAHQKGIIHRDLKPSNILVTLVDGVPTPKIIDFGIAKATQGKLTAHTLVTRFEQMIGTPVYMSPEQADLRDTDIDTRSDIYSLGVLLYELLTGRPPFDPQSLLQAGVAEIRRIIRETDPPRPSTAVATLADADRTTVAQRRRASPARLPSALRGDLDWIVMRCLEKQRDRRYGTAEELGRDIRRHLQHEPVSARPPSALYRARKFVSRHRLACASAAALALAIVAGAAVSTWQAIRATRAEHAARLAQADAQRRQEQAEAILGFMLGDFRTELAKIGKLQLLDAVGEKAMAYFASLPPRDLTDRALAGHARALYQIGDVRMSEARYEDAERAFRASYQRTAALSSRNPRVPEIIFDRGQAEFWLGFVARRRGNLAVARRWFSRYQASAIELSTLGGDPQRARQELIFGYHAMAVMEYETGHYDAAETVFQSERKAVEEALAESPSSTAYLGKLADLLLWTGLVAEWRGELEIARRRFSEANARLRSLVATQPTDTSSRLKLAVSYARHGSILALTGRTANARAAYDEAARIFAALLEQDARNNQWQIEAAFLRLDQAELAITEGAGAVNRAEFEQLRADILAMGPAAASSQPAARLVARSWRLDGWLRGMKEDPGAGAALSEALELSEKSIHDGRADGWMVWEFCQANLLLAKLDAKAGRTSEAKQRGARIFEALRSQDAETSDWRILAARAEALVLLGQPADAQLLTERLRHMGYRPANSFEGAPPAPAK